MPHSRSRRYRLARRFGLGFFVACTASAQPLAANDAVTPSTGSAADASMFDASSAAPALLTVTSDSECPAAGGVSDVLRQIFGARPGDRLTETARLERRATELVVTLRTTDARVLGQRSLPLEGDCDELARAAAVVLATWLSDAHPEFVPKTPLVANAGAEARSSPPNPEHPVGPTGTVRSHGSVRPRGTRRARVSAAIGVAVLPTPPAITGSVAFSFVPDAGGIGATLRAGAVASRSFDIEGGTAHYFRWPFAAGAVLRLPGRHLATEFEAGGALGWLHVEGRSFSPDRSANDATFGPFAGARLGAASGRLRPFVELWSVLWARSARVYADASQPSQRLPNFDLTLSLGAALLP